MDGEVRSYSAIYSGSKPIFIWQSLSFPGSTPGKGYKSAVKKGGFGPAPPALVRRRRHSRSLFQGPAACYSPITMTCTVRSRARVWSKSMK